MNLYQHQKTAVSLLNEHDSFALLMEMGAGKSACVVKDFENKFREGKAKNLLVLGPSGAYRNWYGELKTWLDPEVFEQLIDFTWVSGDNTKSNLRMMDAFIKYEGERPRVLLMNIEALSRVEKARDLVTRFLSGGKTIWAIDESQTIKAPDSQRTKFILSVAHLAAYRRILTGLVAPENPLNVFSQFKFLDERILGHRTFYSFRARYAVTKKVDFKKGPRPIDIVVGYRNTEELQKLISKKSFRVLTADVVDLPEKIYMPLRWVELTEEQHKAYNSMKKLALAEIEGQYVTAAIAASILMKLHSIVCGHAVAESGEVLDIPSNRVKSLLELLEDHSGKALIWAPFPRFLEKMARALEEEYGPESVVRFWGETSNEQRQIAKDRFQNEPKCRWFVSNPSVGGEGNTLTAANLVVYAANSWKNSDRQQSEARAHRIGQKSPVTYVDLAAKGTVDEKLIKALRTKINLAAAVTGDELKQWLI